MLLIEARNSSRWAGTIHRWRWSAAVSVQVTFFLGGMTAFDTVHTFLLPVLQVTVRRRPIRLSPSTRRSGR